MNPYERFRVDINKRNCNARLAHLYELRDDISTRIDANIIRGIPTTQLDETYSQICEVIETLCDYRNEHDGCLLEGELGYGLWT